MAQGRRKERRNLQNPVSLVDLADNFAAIRCFHHVENLHRLKAPACEGVLTQPDDKLRHSGRRLELDFRCPAHASERSRNFLRFLVKLVKVIAKYIDDDRSGITGKRLIDALGEE